MESKSSKESSSYGDNAALAFSSNGQVIIKSSKIYGDRQGLILRTGGYVENGADELSHFIYDSAISISEKNKAEDYLEKKWQKGTDVPLSAIVIGDKEEGENLLGTNIVLSKVKVELPENKKNEADKSYHSIYVYSDENELVSEIYDAECKFEIVNEAKGNAESEKTIHKINSDDWSIAKSKDRLKV